MNSHSSLNGGCCHFLQGTGGPTSDDFRERPCDDRKCILNIDTWALGWQMQSQCTWCNSLVNAALQWEFFVLVHGVENQRKSYSNIDDLSCTGIWRCSRYSVDFLMYIIVLKFALQIKIEMGVWLPFPECNIHRLNFCQWPHPVLLSASVLGKQPEQ